MIYRNRGTWTVPEPYWSPYIPDTTNYQQWQWSYSCPHCSKWIKVDSAYCPHCGATLITEKTETDKLDAVLRKLDELIEIVKSK